MEENIFMFPDKDGVTMISPHWIPHHEHATGGSVGSCWASRAFALKSFAMPLKVRKTFPFINAPVQEGGRGEDYLVN